MEFSEESLSMLWKHNPGKRGGVGKSGFIGKKRTFASSVQGTLLKRWNYLSEKKKYLEYVKLKSETKPSSWEKWSIYMSQQFDEDNRRTHSLCREAYAVLLAISAVFKNAGKRIHAM